MKHAARWLPLLIVAAWSSPAVASPSFPATVDQDLMLTGSMTIEKAAAPPDGCLLCHTTEAGGLGTNNQFGTLMLQDGTTAEEPATVGPALNDIAANEPRAIHDIVMGINPNDDPTALQGALPVPSYGCAVGRAHELRRASTWAPLWAFGLAWIGLAARRRRRPLMQRVWNILSWS
jgi:hypothetical protein